jgi:hypothetical protein
MLKSPAGLLERVKATKEAAVCRNGRSGVRSKETSQAARLKCVMIPPERRRKARLRQTLLHDNGAFLTDVLCAQHAPECECAIDKQTRSRNDARDAHNLKRVEQQ